MQLKFAMKIFVLKKKHIFHLMEFDTDFYSYFFPMLQENYMHICFH